MSSMLIRNARIVDGTSPEPSSAVDIAIENGKFVDVAPNVTFDADETPWISKAQS